MQKFSVVMSILVKVMNLVGSNEKYRIINNIIRLEINTVFSRSIFEPNNLIEAMNMWFYGLTLIRF